MSRVYFHSPSGDAELTGAEQHHFRSIVYGIAVDALGLHEPARLARMRELVNPDHPYLHMTIPGAWARAFETAFRTNSPDYDSPLLTYQGAPIDVFSLALNTAVRSGGNAVKLAAKFAAQAEIHAYVEGPNRAWLADLLGQGLAEEAFRQDMDWESVVSLLRSRDDEPIVTSYSVCQRFPNPDLALTPSPIPDGWMPSGWTVEEWAEEAGNKECWWKDAEHDRWSEQPAEERWAQCLEVIRTNGQGLEIRPDEWDDFEFTHGLAVPDLFADDWRDRIEQALGVERQEA